MTEPEPTAPAGLVPYDLVAPSRLLVPQSHKRRGLRQRSLKLGSEDDAATLEVTTWDACQAGCYSVGSHEAGSSAVLRVPCENLPHCRYCECGSDHSIYLAAAKVAELKAILP